MRHPDSGQKNSAGASTTSSGVSGKSLPVDLERCMLKILRVISDLATFFRLDLTQGNACALVLSCS